MDPTDDEIELIPRRWGRQHDRPSLLRSAARTFQLPSNLFKVLSLEDASRIPGRHRHRVLTLPANDLQSALEAD
jgi:hypothetical protein